MRFYVASSARKHKIGKGHLLAAVENLADMFADQDAAKTWLLGTDDRGMDVEMIVVQGERDGAFIIIHAFPMELRNS